MPKENPFLHSAIEMAKLGGSILTQFWGQITKIDSKDQFTDLVTEADRASEKAILQYVESHFQDHSFLGEESGERRKNHSKYLWVVDPLDGTTNFTHQYPMVSVSVALLEEGVVVVGVVFNPILNEMFTATRGGGASFNGREIHVSQTASLDSALLASGFPYDRRLTSKNNYVEFCRLTHFSQGVRRGGSAALDLSYVAAGRLDGYWELGLKPWDVAAGVLLVEEAGGVVTGYEQAPLDLYSGHIVASNGLIQEALNRELALSRQSQLKF